MNDYPVADRWPVEPTQWGDDTAALMRAYYEANKPLHWWQRRRIYESECADNLMIGLLNIAASAIEARRAAATQIDAVADESAASEAGDAR